MTNLQPALDRLDQFAALKMRQSGTPGMAVALTDRERLLHVATYGFADLAARAPVVPDTRFEIGSDGKAFTAIAILQQVEAGRIDLHAPVTRYLPWFQVRSAYAPITIHHLLSHTAGIIAGTDTSPDGRHEVWGLRETEAATAPGERFHYSEVGYKTLGLVLEQVLGRPYGEIIRSQILEPLGMDATDPTITHETRRRLAVGYASLYDDRPYHRSHPLVPAPWLETDTGDGCLAAPAADMAAYMRMLLNRGRGPRGRILSDESFGLLTGRLNEPWAGQFYGYGLISTQNNGWSILMHGGDMPGFLSSWRADTDNGLGAAVLMNGPFAPGVAIFALKLLRAAVRGEELPPLPDEADPTAVENAADYAGTYRAGERSFVLEAAGERLLLRHGADRVALEPQDDDSFLVDHPDFARFLLRFGRAEGQVSETFHGGDWYVHERYAGPANFDTPEEWNAYPGHYRAHNPWLSNFRVVLRKGALVFIKPDGEEEPLTPLEPGCFRIGAAGSPERLRFDAIAGGQALRANRSGCYYYRFFTP
jgi:D-alanyl-D-alanine carboxypeptidase